jgi:hypothetical protein
VTPEAVSLMMSGWPFEESGMVSHGHACHCATIAQLSVACIVKVNNNDRSTRSSRGYQLS